MLGRIDKKKEYLINPQTLTFECYLIVNQTRCLRFVIL